MCTQQVALALATKAQTSASEVYTCSLDSRTRSKLRKTFGGFFFFTPVPRLSSTYFRTEHGQKTWMAHRSGSAHSLKLLTQLSNTLYTQQVLTKYHQRHAADKDPAGTGLLKAAPSEQTMRRIKAAIGFSHSGTGQQKHTFAELLTRLSNTPCTLG